MAGGDCVKVAVLGGGPAALATAYELTAPHLRERFEVSVYQPGWRLGGKCASGRNVHEHGRIEEHGLHVWFGFYENSFKLIRSVYDELERPAGHPLASFEQAFEACDTVVLVDRYHGRRHEIPVTFPRNRMPPGAGEAVIDFWTVAARVCEWTISRWGRFSDSPSPGAAAVTRLLAMSHRLAGEHEPGLGSAAAFGGAGARAPSGGRTGARARLLAHLLTMARDFMWQLGGRSRCARDELFRLFFTTFDTFACAIRGIVRDGVLEHGWEAINDRDLCQWLVQHGVKKVTIGASPSERAPLLRAVYDLAFAYPEGVMSAADAAAGTAFSNLLRLLFGYSGSLLYKMQAGMGDAVIAPLYQLLQRRGVRFEFFSCVTDLGLSADGEQLDSIEVVPQVELRGGGYEPLLSIKGLECWPSEPRWEQLRDGEQLRRRGVDFELHPNPLDRAPVALRRGEDFDVAVLGIPVGALHAVSGQIRARHPRFDRMLESSRTVATQAFQLWLTKPTGELGWRHGANTASATHVDPLNTWCDMSHLLGREDWPASQEVGGVAYFCGVLEDRVAEGPDQASERVRTNARVFLEHELSRLWPRVAEGEAGEADKCLDSDGRLDWTVLADDRGRSGPERLLAQHWRANTAPSERYVLSPAGLIADRLGAGESGVTNMVLAGDWTRNGIDAGCVESAVTSGMQAAGVLIDRDNRSPRPVADAFSRAGPGWGG
jgi:uncharacterized protein with NAD-binding domain and iron-sulfur cluster